MRITDPIHYCQGKGLSPAALIGCPIPDCGNSFIAARGFAMAATCNGEPVIAFFCSPECFIKAVPRNCCGEA